MRTVPVWTALLVATLLIAVPGGVSAGEGLPPLPDATPLESRDLADGGKRRAYTTTESTPVLVKGYAAALTMDGWTLTRKGARGGATGGGGELIANRNGEHVVLQAGGPEGSTFVAVCLWPKRPANDYCG